MAVASFPEAAAGLLLVFFLPGFALTMATFPEWRVRGPDGLLRLLEIGTLSVVLSVVLTVLAGYVLLAAAPGGFQAYWSAPVLEALLAAIAAIGFAVGAVRGAYSRVPPRPTVPEEAGEVGAWELLRELERLGREERRLTHQLRVAGAQTPEGARLRAELDAVAEERATLQRRREAEYAP